jgi:hypothetical protein
MVAAVRSLIVLLLALVWVAAPASRASAASVNATVKAKVLKPLQLTTKQGLDMGTILLSGTLTSNVTVTLSQAGALTCPSPLTCSGTPLPGIMNLTGSNGNPVIVSAPAIDLANATGAKIRFTPSVPATITLPNSGNNGLDFNMGGSLTITPTTADGTYSGVVVITADYQ